MTHGGVTKAVSSQLALIFGVLATAAQCAAEAPESAVAEQLARLADPAQVDNAISKLKALGPAAVPALVAALDRPDYASRNVAASILGEIGDPSAIPALGKIALSDDELSDIAQQCIAEIGGPDAATFLIAALKHHVTGDRCARIAGDLAAIGDNRAVEPLVQLLRGQLIGRRKRQDTYTELEKIWARGAAAAALGHFRDPRARAALKQAVAEDPDWDVYFAAREALRTMDRNRNDQTWRALIPLAVEKQPEPAKGAEAAVKQWQLDNAQTIHAWTGPSVQDYASPAEIARAQARLVNDAQFIPLEVVEALMTYLRNYKYVHGPAEAQALIVKIGAPAIPALQIGEQRGDIQLKQRSRECLAAIRSQSATRPTR